MRKTIAALLLLAVLAGSLTACASGESPGPTVGTGPTVGPEPTVGAGEAAEPAGSGILVAYLPEESGAVAQAAETIAGSVGGTLADLSAGGGWNLNAYEFVLLGFAAQNSALPEGVQTFLRESDLGARTIYPFVLGQGNAEDAVFAAISDLEPGALLGSSALLLTEGADAESAAAWAEGLSLAGGAAAPQVGRNNTVRTAAVTPGQSQTLYLWEEGNAPATTVYTENNGGYFDDPDFRPYLTDSPVPAGTAVKGAVLICPGGAFQFRSDQPEGVDVAEAPCPPWATRALSWTTACGPIRSRRARWTWRARCALSARTRRRTESTPATSPRWVFPPAESSAARCCSTTTARWSPRPWTRRTRRTSWTASPRTRRPAG